MEETTQELSKTEWYFQLAELVARKSKDRSTKVGAIAVGQDGDIRAVGYNGFVRGFPDEVDKYHLRPLKYDLVTHAEANLVANAARTSTSLKGTTVYITLPPCSVCFALLVQSGVKVVQFLPPADLYDWASRWSNNFDKTIMIQNAVRADIGLYACLDTKKPSFEDARLWYERIPLILENYDE